MIRRAAIPFSVIFVVVFSAAPALATWSAPGSGSVSARALTMPDGGTPSVSVSGRNVTLDWPQSTLASGLPVDGYLITRYDAQAVEQVVGSGCSGTITALACTESAVPPGSWTYRVAPKHFNWSGAQGEQSLVAAVAAPALAFDSPAPIVLLPATLDGDVTGFITGQTLTFRLDDPAMGAPLAGDVTASPIAQTGAASVSVTIPSGTSNGSHAVYAIGSQGDVAATTITVATPVQRTITTSAWDFRDSSGGSLTDQSDYFGFAGDGRFIGPLSTAYGWQPAFDASKYVEFELASVLPAGIVTTSVQFNFTFTNFTTASSCFTFEVRRISTGVLVGTHGNALIPVGCATGSTFAATSTPIPEVTTSDIANDLKIRVFQTNSAGTPVAPGANYVDLATVSGSANGTPFTLYQARYTDATSTPFGFNWWLAKDADAWTYTSSSWDTTFNSAKYLKLTFPAYVPPGASGVAASFTHSYRSDTAGNTTCYYLDVYAGTTLIGSHGSAAAPLCNATSAFASDTIALPEADTVAEVNSLNVRLYVKNSGGQAPKRKSLHDLARLSITYAS